MRRRSSIASSLSAMGRVSPWATTRAMCSSGAAVSHSRCPSKNLFCRVGGCRYNHLSYGSRLWRSRLRRPLAVFLLAVLALARVGPAAAFSAHPTKPIEELLDSSDPYQAFDIVAGYDLERTRRAGFAHCLPEVLVRGGGGGRAGEGPRGAAL